LPLASYLLGQPPAKKPDAPTGKADAGASLAIRKAGQSFVKSYAAGDAKGLASHWTENRRVPGGRRDDDPRPGRNREVVREGVREEEGAGAGGDRGDVEPLPLKGHVHRGGLLQGAGGQGGSHD